MEKEAKASKLEPLKKEHLPQERTSFYSKESQMSRFKFSNTSQRYKTEPSVQNIQEELPKKHSKNKSQFSEEYMSLVNKLRINLSKQLEKKNKIEIVREREYLYNNENRQRNNTFVNGRDTKKKRPFVPKDPYMKLNKRSLTSFQRDTQPEVKTMRVQESSKAYEISFFKASQDSFNKESYLPSMNTLHKGRYELNDTIKEVTEHNSPQKPKKSMKKKHRTSHKSKEKVVAIDRSGHKHGVNHAYEQQQIKQLNQAYNKLGELCFHIQILIDILESLSAKENSSQSPEKMIRILKDYILGNKKYVNNSLLLDDISHLDRIYKHQVSQKQLRTMIFYQRILVVYCIDLLATRSIQKHLHQISHIFHSFLGIYIYFLCVLQQASVPLSNYVISSIQTFQNKISEHNIHIKKQINTTVFFISKKLFPILKTNPTLYKQLKVIVGEFQTRNVTINRSFYELLRLYAIYLNNNQHIIEKDYHVLKTFATCPSPYLTKPPQKKYTLVLDLDETLIHSSRARQKLQIFMRPFLKEFLQVMAKHFQIVIFTSSMPDYSEDIISQLPFISHKLYRYHTTRLKNRHVKDLSRLGRQLENIVMVDNQEQNFLLQKSNGIKVPQWRGDDPSDQELNILGLFLNQLALKQPQDLREHLQLYKSFRKDYE